MKRQFLLLISIFLFITSCSKDKPTSGEVTLDNTLYGSAPYYSLGFNFEMAEKISTLSGKGADITVEAGVITTGEPVEAFLASNTYEPSFFLIGEYATFAEAETEFNALTSFGISTWIDMGAPLEKNQIWIIRTENDKYAKILIRNVVLDTGADPDYASCTFRWVYQPDGSKTFPG